MKLPLVALLVAVIAAPVMTLPTYADAQVRVGSGARRDPPRRARPPAPRLTEAEEDRMWDAQAEVASLNTQIADAHAQAEAAGGATADHQAAIQALTIRLTAEQAVIDRLQAKLDR